MSERINVATTGAAFGNAIQSGTNAAIASIRYDRAIASQHASLAQIRSVLLERERSRVALANLRIRLSL